MSEMITVRISTAAHLDNWSYWFDMLDNAPLSPMAQHLVSQLEAVDYTVDKARREKGKAPVTVKLVLPVAIAKDLMDQHGYLGDAESFHDEYHAISMCHRRAALALYKALRNAEVDVRNPVHWWA